MKQSRMKRALHRITTATLLAGSSAAAPLLLHAQNTTLNFGMPGGTFNLQCIVDGNPINLANYGGFSFGGLRIAQPSQFDGQCAATNSTFPANPMAVITATNGSSFRFQSGVFASVFPTAPTTITIAGFLGATQVFQNSLMLGTSVGSGLSFSSMNTSEITRLEITQTGANPFLLDNFTTSAGGNAGVAVVPEPATWALLAVGLGLLLPLAARKRRV